MGDRGIAAVATARRTPLIATMCCLGTRSASRPKIGWKTLDRTAREPTTSPTIVALARSTSFIKMAMKVMTAPMPRPKVKLKANRATTL